MFCIANDIYYLWKSNEFKNYNVKIIASVAIAIFIILCQKPLYPLSQFTYTLINAIY